MKNIKEKYLQKLVILNKNITRVLNMSNKKTKRDKYKYPNLKTDLNTKLRRDYIDNRYYIDGIKNGNDYVIRPLNDEEKEWLNKFNGEFYNASFDKDDVNNLHSNNADDVTIYNIRQDISRLRKLAAKEQDPELAKEYYKELEEQIEYLKEIYPKKKCQDDNNSRNRCLLNVGKATNIIKFIPWETLDQNTLGDLDAELLYILNDMELEKD